MELVLLAVRDPAIPQKKYERMVESRGEYWKGADKFHVMDKPGGLLSTYRDVARITDPTMLRVLIDLDTSNVVRFIWAPNLAHEYRVEVVKDPCKELLERAEFLRKFNVGYFRLHGTNRPQAGAKHGLKYIISNTVVGGQRMIQPGQPPWLCKESELTHPGRGLLPQIDECVSRSLVLKGHRIARVMDLGMSNRVSHLYTKECSPAPDKSLNVRSHHVKGSDNYTLAVGIDLGAKQLWGYPARVNRKAGNLELLYNDEWVVYNDRKYFTSMQGGLTSEKESRFEVERPYRVGKNAFTYGSWGAGYGPQSHHSGSIQVGRS